MKIIKADWKKGSVSVKVESPEDVWVLSQIIEPGDLARARTLRKVRIGSKDESSSVVKKPVNLTISVTRVSFEPGRNALRISGTVIGGPEDVPRGSHHTFDIEKDSVLMFEKKIWLNFQKKRIEDAAKNAGKSVLICVHDREEAIIAETTPSSFAVLARLKGNVPKKDFGSFIMEGRDFYDNVAVALKEYADRKSPESIIIASPAFWKEELYRAVERVGDESLKKKVVLATCSSVSENAIVEVLKRPETRQALENVRASEEEKVVEEFLERIAKDALATYGLEHVRVAAESGAVEKLLLTNNFLVKMKEEGGLSELEDVMRKTEAAKGEVVIVESEEAAAKLDGLGSVGALLRFRI